MPKSSGKNVSTEVSNETWKKLKIVSIQKEISLGDLIKEILDKFANKKGIEEKFVGEI